METFFLTNSYHLLFIFWKEGTEYKIVKIHVCIRKTQWNEIKG